MNDVTDTGATTATNVEYIPTWQDKRVPQSPARTAQHDGGYQSVRRRRADPVPHPTAVARMPACLLDVFR